MKNLVFHARINHIEMHYNYIRKKAPQEEIEMRLIKIDDQIGDLLTKGLSTGMFEKFCCRLNMEKRMSRS